jgi:hypothetical protein
MPEHPTRELLKAFLDAFNRHDLDAVVDRVMPSNQLLLVAVTAASALAVHAGVVAGRLVPEVRDLTIARRHVSDTSASQTDVLYLKGARQRREFHWNGAARQSFVSITQCDQQLSIQLNPQTKLYTTTKLHATAEIANPREPTGRPLDEEQGALVVTTFDGVDTGERRPAGSYTARRVRTTVTVEASAGANATSSITVTDGWYVDVPGLGCSEGSPTAFLIGQVIRPGALRDRHQYRTKGTARRGYALEETTRVTQPERPGIDRIELIEISDRVLDPSLFEIPAGYHQALPLVGGGYDLTKRDTIVNRLQNYWDEITRMTRSVLR